MAKPVDRPEARRAFAAKPFNEQLKELFVMHKTERRGTAALMVLLLIASGAFWYFRYQYKPSTDHLEPIRAEMEAWLAQRDTAGPIAPIESTTTASELFPFDPNKINADEWRRLGLSARQSASIERYRSKGGRFRSKADLGRMYSLKPEQFARLKPYILLPDSSPSRSASDRPGRLVHVRAEEKTSPAALENPIASRPAAPRRKVDVNSADTTALIALPGIGPSFARGIVKYRESLGGFHSLDQLAEVYVLKDKPDAVVRMKELLTVDTLAIRPIPLNTCTVEELAAHPYARWRIAKPVIAYRTQHGPFKHLDDLRVIPVFDAEDLRKLAPYLSLE